jgi:Rad3-related DNA helicase
MICTECGNRLPYQNVPDGECLICGHLMTMDTEDVLQHGAFGIAREIRPEQIRLGNDIFDLYVKAGFPDRSKSTKSVLLANAGTGTGKSFAYLVSSILAPAPEKDSVGATIIATSNIELQHQLFNKDIPFLQKKLGSDKSVILHKGGSNYGCP